MAINVAYSARSDKIPYKPSRFHTKALMTVAMKFVEAGKFSLLRKCFDMALSFLFQIFYFGVSHSNLEP